MKITTIKTIKGTDRFQKKNLSSVVVVFCTAKIAKSRKRTEIIISFVRITLWFQIFIKSLVNNIQLK